MSARDLARFGLLFAYEGEWGGRRIVSREWVRLSTKPRVPNARNDSRYGYLWWVAPEGDEPAFWAAGNGGQFVMVVPGRQLVVSHVVENDNLIARRAEGRDVTWGEFFAMMRLIGAAAPKPR
jgi:CubicO group peptidase (beta-lactamase class C family)